MDVEPAKEFKLSASDALNTAVDSTTAYLGSSWSTTEREKPQPGSRMTRSQLVLSGPEPVADFKRVRTKFTAEQMRELEALFELHGPHPTREQRVAVAEKINVPPRTVQIFLQNRRQRDTKHRSTVLQTKKWKVDSDSSSIQPALSVPVVPIQSPYKPTVPSFKVNLGRPSLASTTRANVQEQVHFVHPSSIRQAPSLDNIANRPEWKENIPSSDPPSSPSLDEVKPSPSCIHCTPPPTGLWARMLSSPPPLPLSPSKRQNGARRITRGRSGGKLALELACAKAHGSDKPTEEKLLKSDYSTHPLPSPAPKRLREEADDDEPRKRTSILGLDSPITVEDDGPRPSTSKPEEQNVAVRGGSESDSTGGASVGDEIATPDNSVAPSSPSIACVCEVASTHVQATQAIDEGAFDNITEEEEATKALTAREADAAIVLASLFGQV